MNTETTESRIASERAVAVIAGVLAHPDQWPRVRDIIEQRLDVRPRTEWRADAWTRTAWLALTELCEAGREPSPFSLAEAMQRIADTKRKGYLDGWSDAHRERVDALCRRLHLAFAPRVAVAAAHDLASFVDAAAVGAEASALAERMLAGESISPKLLAERTRELARACHSVGVEIPTHNLGAVMNEWFVDETVSHLPSGFAKLDEVAGLFVGATLVAGPSGKGKTTVLQGMALAQAFPNSAMYGAKPSERIVARTDADRPYVFFASVEMPRRQLAARIASSLLVVESRDLLANKREALSHRDVDFAAFRDALDSHGRFTIVDAESLGALSARAVCDALESWATGIRARDPQSKLVACIDYLQFLEHSGEDESARYEQVNQAMRAITNIAREHQIFALVGAQCADTQHPTVRGDIRASKGVVDDAVAVWLIRRDSKNESLLNLFCDKARSGGEHWTVPFHFDGAHNMLTDAAPGEGQPLVMGHSKPSSGTNPFDV